jgi:hypothetical protein
VTAPAAKMADGPHLNLVASVRPGNATRLPQLMSLSQDSLIVRARELLEPGQKVRMTVHLIDSGQEITIIGEVVWANHSLGDMALRFLNLSAGGREAIAEYLVEWAANR